MTQQVTRLHPSLPVFLVDRNDRHLLYAPGESVGVNPAEALKLRKAAPPCESTPPAFLGERGSRIWRRAAEAKIRWGQQAETPFAPECLTIYLSNRCDLSCKYCYAASRLKNNGNVVSSRLFDQEDLPLISDGLVEKATHYVARHCHDKEKPLTVVFHGGGEPTLHWDLLTRLVAITRNVAREHGVLWRSYLATHGALSVDKSRWLAKNIPLIGLSCDGPPDIQDRQRPRVGGQTTSALVERFAQVLRRHSAAFTVRVTVTKETVHRQAEIVRYVHDVLGGRDIRFEPAYAPYHRGENSFAPEDAELFVQHFRVAEDLARSIQCQLAVSGARLDEIHGPYCNVLRDVLHLTPDGTATACFLSTDGRRSDQQQMVIGHLDAASGEFVCDENRIAEIRRRAVMIPHRCEQCVNIYHCSRDCPEVCPVVGGEDEPRSEGGFRCRVLKQLSERWIWGARDETDSVTTASEADGEPSELHLLERTV